MFSAGTEASAQVHSKAVKVMNEIRIDLENNFPKNVNQFIIESFDYVIRVCDDAKENSLIFSGSVKERIQIGFEDSTEAIGMEEEILNQFRRVRAEIKKVFFEFYAMIGN